MSRLFASAVLAVILLGSTLLAMPATKACSAGCCTKPADCPHPTCCVKR